MCRRIHRTVFHHGARRICPEKVVIVPIHRRSDRSRYEPAAAIGTDIFKNVLYAGGAEGALIRADARHKRVGWQRFITVFAGRSEFKHEILDSQLPVIRNR